MRTCWCVWSVFSCAKKRSSIETFQFVFTSLSCQYCTRHHIKVRSYFQWIQSHAHLLMCSKCLFLCKKEILYWDVSVCIYLTLLPVLYAPSEVVINLVVNSINQVFAPNNHGLAHGFPAHFWWHEGVKFVSFFLFLSAISHHSLSVQCTYLTHPPSCIVCTNYLPVSLIFLNLCKLIFPLTFACVSHANVQFSFGY